VLTKLVMANQGLEYEPKKHRTKPNNDSGRFTKILAKLTKEVSDDFEIWLSCDEEGNEFLPMLRNPKFSLSIDKDTNRIIFFPSHR